MRTSSVLGVVLLISAIDTGISQSYVYTCDNPSYSGYYGENATFSNVYINASLSYRFSCEYGQYKKLAKFLNSTFDEVPKKLFDTFQGLTNAILSNCNIQQINRYSMEHAAFLQLLDLSLNALEEVKSYAFSGASALVTLNLSNNRITTIEPTAFYTMPALQILYLQGNKLRLLDGALFSNLVALRYLFLNKNELEVIDGKPFEANTKLQYLRLHDNRISVVGDDVFNTGSLLLVSLSNNKLKKLNLQNARVTTVLVSNNSLEELYLSPWIETLMADNNQITQILGDRSANMSIETLKLENNSLSSIEMINWMRSLKILDLTNNKLGSLAIDSFAKLTKLEQLRLERTDVTGLQHGTFAQQELLQWLDLSNNNLDQFDLDILTSSTHLKTLFLDGNRLKSIEYKSLKTMFPELVELGLVDNLWNCTFLTNIVRYCNEHGIKLIKGDTTEEVQKQTNVKGIYCYDEKNPIRNWNTTVQHLLGANASESDVLQTMLQSVLDDVQRFSKDHTAAVNKMDKLEGTILDLTRRQISLDSSLVELRKSLLDMRLSLLSNRTNMSAVGAEELQRMINSVNNLTLEKQRLSEERLELKINTQSFRVDQALEVAKESRDKVTNLAKRLEEWFGSMSLPLGRGGLVGADKQQQMQYVESASSAGDASTGLLVAVLVLVCIMTGVSVFSLLRSKIRRLHSVERRRYVNRDSSLSTIVDNDI
ncbi:toll-like receptor 6 [Anopheles ziemanni]|uniref:toll-like receptor 6 n=2 Tax=Anopheles coustani TaxID=139045 RepID=UPI0026595E65|nr:toll-like receptor 6 [Anopheles coustani]XP_058178436.1 toll-like receptor 6 [Anopheles ziemanni]